MTARIMQRSLLSITRVVGGCALVVTGPLAAQTGRAPDLANQVEVRRTAHGVPHIKAANLAAAAYALAWVQLEDYGPRVAVGLLRARGEMGRFFGRDSMESDFGAQRDYALAVENYARLDQSTRHIYEGFATGVNRHNQMYPQLVTPGIAPNITGNDDTNRDV